jgi:hypothetical protein
MIFMMRIGLDIARSTGLLRHKRYPIVLSRRKSTPDCCRAVVRSRLGPEATRR